MNPAAAMFDRREAVGVRRHKAPCAVGDGCLASIPFDQHAESSIATWKEKDLGQNEPAVTRAFLTSNICRQRRVAPYADLPVIFSGAPRHEPGPTESPIATWIETDVGQDKPAVTRAFLTSSICRQHGCAVYADLPVIFAGASGHESREVGRHKAPCAVGDGCRGKRFGPRSNVGNPAPYADLPVIVSGAPEQESHSHRLHASGYAKAVGQDKPVVTRAFLTSNICRQHGYAVYADLPVIFAGASGREPGPTESPIATWIEKAVGQDMSAVTRTFLTSSICRQRGYAAYADLPVIFAGASEHEPRVVDTVLIFIWQGTSLDRRVCDV